MILVAQVLWKLLPIAREVYAMVQDPARPDVTPDTAVDWIKSKAEAAGMPIGNTEAELARSALHYAVAKGERHELMSEGH